MGDEAELIQEVEVEKDANEQYASDVSDVGREPEQAPEMTSLDWTPWVLRHLHEDEFFNGNPKVDGLRRVAEVVYGEIANSQSTVFFSPTGNTVVVVHDITFLVEGVHHRHFSGTADANSNNTTPPFNKYLSAIAETRAEGRALRRALKLRNVVLAEEIADAAAVSDESITDNQYNAIGLLAKRLDINIEKMTHRLLGKKIKGLRDVKKEQAEKLINNLNDFQRNNSLVPEEIKGHDNNWRESFNG